MLPDPRPPDPLRLDPRPLPSLARDGEVARADGPLARQAGDDVLAVSLSSAPRWLPLLSLSTAVELPVGAARLISQPLARDFRTLARFPEQQQLREAIRCRVTRILAA